MMNDQAKRQAIIDACLDLNARGLNQGTSGNVSLRHDTGMLITPSAVAYDQLGTDDIARLSEQSSDKFDGTHPPSSEWRFHRDIYAARPEISAIVHTHSPYATTLSMLRMPIPACHYIVAIFGGSDVRCADYGTYGTQALSDHILAAMTERFGCLIGSHGMIACGEDLAQAMWRAEELETLARQYHQALQIGTPVILSDGEVARVAKKMNAGYGATKSEPGQ